MTSIANSDSHHAATVFELPELPFARSALEPHVSSRAVRLHYERYHRGCVDALNHSVFPAHATTLEDLVRHGHGDVARLASEVWNHGFYWSCLRPSGARRPDGALVDAIEDDFGSFEQLCLTLIEAGAQAEHGRRWVWLAAGPNACLAIRTTPLERHPLQSGLEPLLAIDVAPHAYRIDYGSDRLRYLEAVVSQLVDWRCVSVSFATLSS